MILCCASNAKAQHAHAHPTNFHAFRFEGDIGAGENDTVSTWDLDGWVGNDFDKLWLKSEGEVRDSEFEQAEAWALYSKNVSDFWDAQAGLRYDFEPGSRSYLVLGVQGLAKYYFETEAHLFISHEGELSARLRQENDLLITQFLVLKPYVELNLYAQDVPDSDVGAGFTDGELGIQTRYEITRRFAPYLDLRYERSFGETGHIELADGKPREDFIASVGLMLRF